MKTTEALIYHLLPPADWEQAQHQGDYRPVSLGAEGFIHLSTRSQVANTLANFFSGHTGLIMLAVEVARLQAELRYDSANDQLFPHLYGPLNLDAVVDVFQIAPGSDDPFSDSAE